ncbi:MAG: PQQ-binding-like beta-propeller repeat protein [Prolixibacteraceae bacterium]|jgi:outer membrane protein assembly factor BamB|nr:PQQ-binding-like beta-propeller repeat protein [Prolixibacteraceae bacterium]
MQIRNLLLVVVLLCTVAVIKAQEPTKWRGEQQNGVYPDKNLLETWPESGPEVIWHYEGLGEGHSSPVIVGDKIYLSSMIDSTGYIFVLDMQGSLLQKYPYGEEFFESYPGARSTPVVDGDWLYIMSGKGVVYAMNAATGDIKWEKDLFKEFDGKNINWGVTETLKLDGDKLFCSPGGDDYNVIALDRNNGELIWKNKGLGELSAYCTPLIVDLPERKLLVTMMASHILGIDAEDGELLWSYEQTNRWSVHANTPVYYDGGLVCTSGYGQGTVKLNLSDDGSSVEKDWHNEDLDSRMGGVVILDGYVYASGDNSRKWQCVDFETGEEKWSTRELGGRGVVITADDKLFLYSDRGDLAMVKATHEEFKILGQTKVEYGTAQHWSHPVIHNGMLYLRHGNALIAYKIK